MTALAAREITLGKRTVERHLATHVDAKRIQTHGTAPRTLYEWGADGGESRQARKAAFPEDDDLTDPG